MEHNEVRYTKAELLTFGLMIAIVIYLWLPGPVCFLRLDEQGSDADNTRKIKRYCHDYETWHTQFPKVLKKTVHWESDRRNRQLLHLYTHGRLDGGNWFSFLDAIEKTTPGFREWLQRDHPNEDDLLGQKREELLLHYTVYYFTPDQAE